jgi:hypothetical protein
MTPDRYDYCKIFVRNAVPDDVEVGLSAVLGSPFAFDDLELANLRVEVRRNPDHGDPRITATDFVVWPVQVELVATSGEAGPAMVATTTAVLEHLWSAGHDAIAACDYEDELPWSGGIRRPAVDRDEPDVRGV